MIRRKIAPPDAKRIGQAVSFPGIDPRTWIATARVELDSDSLRWDASLGWVVDIVVYGGDLEGDADIVCRTMSVIGGDGAGHYSPPAPDAEVIVALPSGDPEVNPVVLGYLNSEAGNGAPTEINGLPIVGESETSTEASVSPFDTELLVSPHSLRSQRDGQEFREAARHVLEATDATDGVLLGSRDADQAVILGDDYNQQVTTAIDGLIAVLETLAGMATLPDLPAFKIRWLADIKPALSQALSQRVKTE